MAAGHQPSTEQTTGRKRNGKQSEEIPHEGNTVHLMAGVQDLDGATALAYARYRYTEGGDFERAQRQQDVIMALFEQFPAFDDYDDEFVENEEEWTAEVAHYVDDHIERFGRIE